MIHGSRSSIVHFPLAAKAQLRFADQQLWKRTGRVMRDSDTVQGKTVRQAGFNPSLAACGESRVFGL
jgi:hypothetical protein